MINDHCEYNNENVGNIDKTHVVRNHYSFNLRLIFRLNHQYALATAVYTTATSSSNHLIVTALCKKCDANIWGTKYHPRNEAQFR